MSDPQRPYGRAAFEPVPEPEDMSVFLHNLLHTSPAVLTASPAAGPTSAVLDYRGSGASLNFSDPGSFFDSEAEERAEKAFYSAASGDCDAGTSSSKRDELTSANKVFEASDATRNRVHPNSSKRIRSAEVHNMSEKRRRSKINEKLKALQNLVPNSNKTDKASMLDEAIEYLKQLQTHVQEHTALMELGAIMLDCKKLFAGLDNTLVKEGVLEQLNMKAFEKMLTIRNGLSLHQTYVPGGLPSMQLPADFDAGIVLPNNNNRGLEALPGNQEVVVQAIFGTHNPKLPGHQVAVPSLENNSIPGMSFGAESTLPSHFGFFNHLASAKDLCREETMQNLPLDVGCSRNKSTSGVSS